MAQVEHKDSADVHNELADVDDLMVVSSTPDTFFQRDDLFLEVTDVIPHLLKHHHIQQQSPDMEERETEIGNPFGLL